MNVPQALAEAARKHAGRPALLGAGLALTHAQLEQCVAQAAAALDAKGIKPGQVIGVAMQTSPLHLLTLLALARLGACSVHVHPDHPRPVKRALVAQFDIAGAVCDPGANAPVEADPAWLEPGTGASFANRATADQAWRIALSSGTTGLQKAIVITQADAVASIRTTVASESIADDDRLLIHRGLDSNWALRTALAHLVRGGAVVFPATRTVSHLLEAIKHHRVTRMMVSPAFLRDLMEQLPPGGNALPTLRYLLVGGGAATPELVAAASERVTPHVATGYGVVEFGIVALSNRELLARAPSSVGRLLAGVQGEAVDERGAPVPAGKQGILRFRRDGMPREYFRNPEASARAFRDGWFYPGDVGRIDAQGLLYIDGRIDEKLNLDGVKIDPLTVEAALQAHPAVFEAAAFAAAADRERSALFAAAVLRAPVDEKALIAHCRGRLGPMFTPARIFFVKTLPRNEAGKLLRAELSGKVARRRG